MRETIHFHYQFKLSDGSEKHFDVHLDPHTLKLLPLDKEALRLVPAEEEKPPRWTELTYKQCPNCPLDATQVKSCPVAMSVFDVMNFFECSISHEEVDLVIKTKEREYAKHLSLQKGISSLLGIYMVTCGCPNFDKLKPMVRHHLPFATLEETQYRVLSMYLLAQFFLMKKGGTPDWDLKELPKIYEEIRISNRALCERFITQVGEDAIPNAVVILDTFAQAISFVVDREAFQKIEKLFQAYL